jgi:molybdopterin converting factor subunit 1
MTLTVKLFAAARELAGRGEIDVELPESATVGSLRRALGEVEPALAPLVARSMIAVNEEYCGDSTPLRAGDAAAIIPPVSGG